MGMVCSSGCTPTFEVCQSLTAVSPSLPVFNRSIVPQPFPAPPPPPPLPSAKELIDRARSTALKSDYKEALALATRVIKTCDISDCATPEILTWAYCYASASANRLNDKKLALELVNQGIELGKSLVPGRALSELMLVKGAILWNIGDAAGELETYDDAVRLFPKDSHVLCERAYSLLLLNRCGEAWADLLYARTLTKDFDEIVKIVKYQKMIEDLPLAKWTTLDMSTWIKSLGHAYVEYSAIIEHHSISGSAFHFAATHPTPGTLASFLKSMILVTNETHLYVISIALNDIVKNPKGKHIVIPQKRTTMPIRSDEQKSSANVVCTPIISTLTPTALPAAAAAAATSAASAPSFNDTHFTNNWS